MSDLVVATHQLSPHPDAPGMSPCPGASPLSPGGSTGLVPGVMYLSLKGVSVRYGVTRQTVVRWVNEGVVRWGTVVKLRAVVVGGSYRFSERDLAAFEAAAGRMGRVAGAMNGGGA